MGNPIPSLTPIPQSQVDTDLAAWAAAQQQKQQMIQQLQALLAMLAAIKDPQVAFMMCMNQVLPQVMQVQNSGEGVLGYSNFVDSDIQKEVTSIQALFNELSNDPSNANARQLVLKINALETQLKTQLQNAENDPNSSPMDKDDLKNMIQQIDTFKGMFNGNWGDSSADVGYIAQEINVWTTSGETDKFKTATNTFQLLNQTTGAMSTATSAMIQAATETDKQDTDTLQNMYKSWSQTVEAFIQNQKST